MSMGTRTSPSKKPPYQVRPHAQPRAVVLDASLSLQLITLSCSALVLAQAMVLTTCRQSRQVHWHCDCWCGQTGLSRHRMHAGVAVLQRSVQILVQDTHSFVLTVMTVFCDGMLQDKRSRRAMTPRINPYNRYLVRTNTLSKGMAGQGQALAMGSRAGSGLSRLCGSVLCLCVS